VAAVGRQAPRDVAADQAEAVEVGHLPVADDGDRDHLGQAAQRVADDAVRGLVKRLAVDQRRARLECCVKQAAEIRRVLLAVLVESRHPVGARRRHAGERGGMLAEVPGQPDERHERITGGQGLHHHVGVVDGAVVVEDDLGHRKAPTPWRGLGCRQRGDLREQEIERALPLVHGHDDRQALNVRSVGADSRHRLGFPPLARTRLFPLGR
jgi:hypothetical protein